MQLISPTANNIITQLKSIATFRVFTIILFSFMFSVHFTSCQKNVVVVGDDEINASPFKKNLLKKGGEWEVMQEDEYYTKDNNREFLGSTDPVRTGIMKFTDDHPPISIAGRMGTWTPINGNSTEFLYQVTAQKSIQITMYDWIDNKTANHSGYTADLTWTKENMRWEGHDHSYQGDTLIQHIYHFRNLGY